MRLIMQSQRRRGFTLLEVLVVIAILSVLAALLLPAIQAAREAARRTQCRNNLRQMGLALHTYHESMSVFPMGYVSPTQSAPLNTSPGWGWAALILPHLDQRPLYDSVNFSLPIELSENQTARTTAVGVYACPSDTAVGTYAALSEWGGVVADVHTNSYAACFGSGQEIDEFPDSGNGIFIRNRSTRIADIRDGTSQTVAIGERGACLVMTPWAGAPINAISQFSSDTRVWTYDTTGHGGELVLARAYWISPNAQGTGTADFYSAHADGIHFLFADGSVRLVKSTVNLSVYRALCTRDGGELIDSGSY
jgi:prepilin-type N-terminal cleavage/methylation domain-containing protein/prepilin-type processing-associated H-X9-DG protein